MPVIDGVTYQSSGRGNLPRDAEPDVQSEAAVVEDADSAPTTAMVAEIRNGLLYIYMPPTEKLEHFVDLISRVEAAAAKADCPVVIEGYGPPTDPRLTSMTVTPDPGVIEVNVAPSSSFVDQKQMLETL